MFGLKTKNLGISAVISGLLAWAGIEYSDQINALLPDFFGQMLTAVLGTETLQGQQNLFGMIATLVVALFGGGIFATGRRVKTRGRVALKDYFPKPEYADLPVSRRGYSDRLAYTLAELSDLAYFDVYTEQELGALKAISKTDNPVQVDLGIVAMANSLLYKRKYLMIDEFEDVLGRGGFTPLAHMIQSGGSDAEGKQNTQCFVALHERSDTKDADYLVVSFRGSETDIDDWLTNADAVPATQVLAKGQGKVHQGFYEAYRSVQDQVLKTIDEARDKYGKNLPVFFTGHSLGGALAVIATRLNAVDSNGACYTFGAPRAGGYDFFKGLKTPVYRVVNASDLVPRVPPGVWGNLVIMLLNLGAFLSASIAPLRALLLRAREFVDKINDYRHYGDLRFLPDVPSANIDDLAEANRPIQILTNPNQFDMVQWFFRHVLVSFGMPIKSHSMKLYRNKLLRVANTRIEKLHRDERQIDG